MKDITDYCGQVIRHGLRFAVRRAASAPGRTGNEVVDLLRLEAAAAAVRHANGGSLLVAAYGSLPSKPEHGLVRPRRAVIPGFRKSLCIAVRTHRGTPQRPGLVAGLLPDRRDSAMALVFEADPAAELDLLARLARRELFGKAYDPRPLRLRLDDGSERLTLGFAATPCHPDVCEFSARTTARIVAQAAGDSGSNADYLQLTLRFERSCFGAASPALAGVEALLNQMNPQPGSGERSGSSGRLDHFLPLGATA